MKWNDFYNFDIKFCKPQKHRKQFGLISSREMRWTERDEMTLFDEEINSNGYLMFTIMNSLVGGDSPIMQSHKYILLQNDAEKTKAINGS